MKQYPRIALYAVIIALISGFAVNQTQAQKPAARDSRSTESGAAARDPAR